MAKTLPARVLVAATLTDASRALRNMSYDARSVDDKAHLRRASLQVATVAEEVALGARSPAYGQYWLDATRVWIGQWEAQHARVN